MNIKQLLKNELTQGMYLLVLMFLVWSIMIWFGWLPQEWMAAKNIILASVVYFITRLGILLVSMA